MYFLFVLAASVAVFPVDAAETEIESAIAQFLADPLGDTQPGRVVLEFAKESPDHEVIIDERFLPWIKQEPNPKCGPLLLTAYVAGDLREQFKKKTGKPESYAGVLAMIAVYAKIKAEAGIEPVSEMEKMIAWEREGVLKERLGLQ